MTEKEFILLYFTNKDKEQHYDYRDITDKVSGEEMEDLLRKWGEFRILQAMNKPWKPRSKES